MLEQVPDLLGEHDDAEGFTTHHAPVADAWRSFRAWRVPRSGLVVQALVPAVIEQKVTGQESFGGYRRLVRRFGWTAEEDPVKVEALVAGLLPRSTWTMFSHRVIFHGRRVCHARRPACGACGIARLCPSYGLGPTDPETAQALVRTMPGCGVAPQICRPVASRC